MQDFISRNVYKVLRFVEKEREMIHIAIVDDEKEWQKKAIDKITTYWKEDYEIDTFSNGEDFLESQKEYHIVFMDVELGEDDGFEVYAAYNKEHKNTILIMFTTHTEFARKGYQYDAFRYIDKSQLEEIEEVVEALKKKLVQQNSIDIETLDGNTGRVLLRDIIYIEAQGRSLHIATTKGVLLCKEKIAAMEERLKNYGFYLIHRSYLVNLEWIKAHDIKHIFLKNDEVIYVSRRRYPEFRQVFFHWKIERGNG